MTIPVRLPDGTTRPSLAALARELRCRRSALYLHITAHCGGYAILETLPDPINVGRRGGPRHTRRLRLLPPRVEETPHAAD